MEYDDDGLGFIRHQTSLFHRSFGFFWPITRGNVMRIFHGDIIGYQQSGMWLVQKCDMETGSRKAWGSTWTTTETINYNMLKVNPQNAVNCFWWWKSVTCNFGCTLACRCAVSRCRTLTVRFRNMMTAAWEMTFVLQLRYIYNSWHKVNALLKPRRTLQRTLFAHQWVTVSQQGLVSVRFGDFRTSLSNICWIRVLSLLASNCRGHPKNCVDADIHNTGWSHWNHLKSSNIGELIARTGSQEWIMKGTSTKPELHWGEVFSIRGKVSPNFGPSCPGWLLEAPSAADWSGQKPCEGSSLYSFGLPEMYGNVETGHFHLCQIGKTTIRYIYIYNYNYNIFIFWLVVWNIFYFSICQEESSQLTKSIIFQRG